MKFHFDIRQIHIDTGVQGEPDSCPVALAIKEAGYERSVGDEIIIDGLKFKLPQAVSDFVADFDGGENPVPFSFDLTDNDLIKEEEDDESV